VRYHYRRLIFALNTTCVAKKGGLKWKEGRSEGENGIARIEAKPL